MTVIPCFPCMHHKTGKDVFVCRLVTEQGQQDRVPEQVVVWEVAAPLIGKNCGAMVRERQVVPVGEAGQDKGKDRGVAGLAVGGYRSLVKFRYSAGIFGSAGGD